MRLVHQIPTGKTLEPSSGLRGLVHRLRSFTMDDATKVDSRMRFYTVEQVSPKQSITPEGFLLCEGVPIARTGEMMYGPGETPVEVGPDGVVRITRDEAEVFRPAFVLSFAGKPVVNEHPPQEVNPQNWKNHVVGTVLNPRRGEGVQSEFLLADLLICDESTIREVRAGKREVSCGYDAEYEELAPGRGRQYDMVGNHVALVASGRCGPRCAIGDRKTTGDRAMPKTKDKSWWGRFKDRVMQARSTAKDEAEFEEKLDEARDEIPEEDPVNVHVHTDSPGAVPGAHEGMGARGMSDDDLENRFRGIEDSLEEIRGMMAPPAADPGAGDADPSGAELEVISDNLAEEAPVGAQDAARKAKDSSYLADSFQETAAMAEILVPGIRIPVFDKAAQPTQTLDAICSLRRSALDLAYATSEGRTLIEQINGGRPLDTSKLKCQDMRTVFRAAAGLKKSANNTSFQRDTTRTHAADDPNAPKRIKTVADLNRRLTEHYGAPRRVQ